MSPTKSVGDMRALQEVIRRPLKLFRRHDSKCVKGYPKDHRIYEHDNVKVSGKAQCDCKVYAEGTLIGPNGSKQYLRPTNTDKRIWQQARAVALNWETWGNTEPPLDPIQDAGQLRSVVEAVESFYTTTSKNGASADRVTQLKHLLTNRLIPFAAARKIEYVQQMDNAVIWSEFRNSWTNLNPLRNRKPQAGILAVEKPLSRGTEARFVADLRFFITYCISREWLSDNWASREHKMIASATITPKDPFDNQDLAYIYAAAEHVTDGKGFSEKRTGTQNGWEILVFAWVMRHTGLRISDVVTFSSDQLVSFEVKRYTHAIWCNPKKTDDKDANFVKIPIPNGKVDGPNLVAALQSLPLKHGKYFFLGGGKLPERGSEQWHKRVKHATNNWRARFTKLFEIAATLLARDGKSFSVHPHPHRFRHTFCAYWLQLGVSVRLVAEYIGDTEGTVRQHYAKFCVAEQKEAARILDEAMGPVKGMQFMFRPADQITHTL